MRVLLAAFVVACAQPRKAPEPTPPALPTPITAQEPTEPARVRVVAPAIGAAELIEKADVASFKELRAAAIDNDAMEQWFSRKPDGVYLYTERTIGDEPPDQVRGRCQRVALDRRASVLNAITVVAWERGDRRLVLELGQTTVNVEGFERERGAWDIRSVRTLPMEAVGWDGTHIRYAEDARRYEVACVPAVRAAPCHGTFEQLGYCVDRELVVRPWRPALVPHVGAVRPAYSDAIPALPEGKCDATCEPSACDEALRTHGLSREPLYAETAPVFAAFRTEAACRAFASSRKPPIDDRTW